MASRVLLVDGDILAYTVAARVETVIAFGDSLSYASGKAPTADRKRLSSDDEAKAEFHRGLEFLQDELKPKLVLICMSDARRRYFRHDILPEYKAGRTSGEPPKAVEYVKKYIRQLKMPGVEVMEYAGLEADDLLGIMGSKPRARVEPIIVTTDKDLNQIAGLHVKLKLDDPLPPLVNVTPAEAEFFFWKQCLMGDATDGVPGCPGIGPVKAEKILLNVMKTDPTPTAVWAAIEQTYERALGSALGKVTALQMARCVRILRDGEFDTQKNKPILWTPPVEAMNEASR